MGGPKDSLTNWMFPGSERGGSSMSDDDGLHDPVIASLRGKPESERGIVKKFLCIAALSILAALAFQSVAAAQETTGFTGECAGAAEKLAADQPNVQDGVFQSYLNYVSDVDGCVAFEGTTFIDGLSVPVYDPDTGEELGILKDLDPDLSSGDFSLTYEEFCGGFIPAYEDVAQDYYDQQANSQEQAILDPDGDGLACTDEDDAFLAGDAGQDEDDGVAHQQYQQPQLPAGQDDPCAGAAKRLGIQQGQTSANLELYPELGGCAIFEATPAPFGVLYTSVYDPDTGEELGILKDLDPDLTGGDFSVSYEELCGAFPTPEAEGFSYAGLTAQEYYDQEANDKERPILDPDGDGLACTSDDEAFLSGDYEPEFEFEETWTGIVTQTDPDGETIEFDIEAEMMPLSDITDDMIGEVIGEVGYPSLGCYGVWVLEGFDGDSLIIEERITEGGDKCSETPVTLTPREDGSLECYFRSSSGIVGECVLTLQGSGNYDEAQFEETWSGFITEFDDEDNPTGGYELEIEIMPISEMTEDMVGEVVGRSRLSLGCTGIYYLEEVNEDSVRVEGQVETGFENCVDGIHVLTPQADGTLEHYSPDESNDFMTRGILTRQGSFAPYDVDLPLGETWTGLMTQTMQDGTTLEFDLEVELLPISEMTEGMIGQIVGETSQEGVECNGVWLLEEVGEDSVVVEERITDGAEYCVQSTRITLTPQDDDSLEYYFLDSYGSTGEGILTLQESNPPEYEMEEIGVPDPERVATDGRKPSEIMDELGMNELPDTGGPAIFSPPVAALLLASGIWGVMTIRRRT